MFSVAVPPVTTSTANEVDAPGRWLTVTGTFSDPPETFSATEAVYFDVSAASVPNATFAVPASASVIVTVALSAPLEAADQPVTEVEIVTVNVSESSTSPSVAIGMLSVAVAASCGTVTVAAVVPVSDDVAVMPVPVYPYATLRANPPAGAARPSWMVSSALVPSAALVDDSMA